MDLCRRIPVNHLPRPRSPHPNLHVELPSPGFRGAATAHPPGRFTGTDACRKDTRVVHRIRLTRPRRGRLHRATVLRAPRRPRRRPRRLRPVVHVTPVTTDLTTAQRWFEEFEGAGLDGVVAKPLTITYQPDKRVKFKVKHVRTADCVVAGYRVHKSGDDAIGSLLLGLFKDDGTLRLGRCHRRLPDGRTARAFRRITVAGDHFRCPPVELGCPRWPATAHHAEMKARAGTPARTSRSYRCGPSGSSRSATTTWKVKGSATPRSSTDGDPTATHAHAPTRNSTTRSVSALATLFPG